MAETQRAFLFAAIPDVHTPFHDPRALIAVAKLLKTLHIDSLVQLGDLADHESISRFVQDSPKKLADGHLLEEWAVAKQYMKTLLEAARFKNKSCSYFQLQGNHETRTLKFEDRFPMLRGLFDLSKHLELEQRGGVWVKADSEGEILRFEWVKEGRAGYRIRPAVYKNTHRPTEILHGTTCIHGWRFNTHNAKATADLFPYPGNIVFGHVHQNQVFTVQKWGGHKVVANSVGWLGQEYPEYVANRPNNWTQGIALVYMHPTQPGLTNVRFIEIQNGKLIGPDGLIYSA